MKKIPLTVNGAEQLKAELQKLKSVARPAIIEAIAEARSHGDLSEKQTRPRPNHQPKRNPRGRQNRFRCNRATAGFGHRRKSPIPNCGRRRSRHQTLQNFRQLPHRPRPHRQRRRRHCRSAGTQRLARIRNFKSGLFLNHTKKQPAPCCSKCRLLFHHVFGSSILTHKPCSKCRLSHNCRLP